MRRCIRELILITMGREYSAQFQEDNYIQRMKQMSCYIRKCWNGWVQKAKIDREQANELEYVDESQKPDTTESANASNGSTGGKPVRNPERERPKWEDTITNRMQHWSYTPEQKEEVKKALAAGVPKATILTYFYPEVTVEKMSSYRNKH